MKRSELESSSIKASSVLHQSTPVYFSNSIYTYTFVYNETLVYTILHHTLGYRHWPIVFLSLVTLFVQQKFSIYPTHLSCTRSFLCRNKSYIIVYEIEWFLGIFTLHNNNFYCKRRRVSVPLARWNDDAREPNRRGNLDELLREAHIVK